VTDPEVATANAKFDITRDAPWADQVLSVLSRAWPSLSKTDREKVVELLSPKNCETCEADEDDDADEACKACKACIPTSDGLKLPRQAYFSNVESFENLPIVSMPSGAKVRGDLKKVLEELGVRRHVKLQIVFDRFASSFY
jgi:hypothetical protein